MSAVRRKFEVLTDDVNWFACATELRAHFVVVEPDLIETAVRIILSGSRAAAQPTPYLTCLAPFAGPDAGWTDRVRIVDEARARLAEELAARGKNVPPSRHGPVERAEIGAFAVRVLELASATSAGCAPPVVVLAPESIEHAERWSEELHLLLERPELSSIRWVVAVASDTNIQSALSRLGRNALVTDCRVSQGDASAILAEMTENSASAPATGAPLAVLGMAWPRVTPPVRRDLAGNPIPTFVPNEADLARREARVSIMRAAGALNARNGEQTIRHFRAAADSFARVGLDHEAIMVRFTMATTVATFGETPLACRELDKVAADAKRLARSDVASQAITAKAGLLAGRKDFNAAIEAYSEAVTLARAAGPDSVPLLIEVLRAAGQFCLATRQDERAVACFREALSVAQAAPPVAAMGAADVADALAAACRERGLLAQAESLEAQAAHFRSNVLSDPSAQTSGGGTT